MNFLHDKRRAGVLALLTVLLGAAALFFGTGSAHAGYPCNDDAAPDDTTVTVNNQTFVGVDTNLTAGSPTTPWVWVCAAATGGEANQRYVVVTGEDPAGSAPGYTVQGGGCTGVVGGDPYPPGCTYLLKPTGAEVDPAAGVNSIDGATAGTGGSVGTGSGTCTYVNGGTPTCPGGLTLAGVTVHEGDLPAVTPTSSTPPPACTGVNNTCPGAHVIVGGDTSHDTVETTVADAPVHRDVPRTCVQVNSICPQP